MLLFVILIINIYQMGCGNSATIIPFNAQDQVDGVQRSGNGPYTIPENISKAEEPMKISDYVKIIQNSCEKINQIAEAAINLYKKTKIEQDLRIYFSENLLTETLNLMKQLRRDKELWKNQRKKIIIQLTNAHQKCLDRLLKKYPQKPETKFDFKSLEQFMNFPQKLNLLDSKQCDVLSKINAKFKLEASGRYDQQIKRMINIFIDLNYPNFNRFKEELQKIFKLKNGKIVENKIGTKINMRTKKYDEIEMEEPGVKIKSPEILRIIMKEIEGLESTITNDDDNEDFLRGVEAFIVDYVDTAADLLKNESGKVYTEAQIASFALAQITSGLANKLLSKIIDKNLKAGAAIDFKVYDLLRAKCQGTKQEIKQVYQNLSKSPLFKILRIKNRLKTGNQDYNVNMQFNGLLICQLQMGILLEVKDQSTEDDILNDHFNHYLYELRRSKYGAVTQAGLLNMHTNQEIREIGGVMDKIKTKWKTPKLPPSVRIQGMSSNMSIIDHTLLINPLIYICCNCSRIRYPTNSIFKSFQNNAKKEMITCEICFQTNIDSSQRVRYILSNALSGSKDFKEISIQQLNKYSQQIDKQQTVNGQLARQYLNLATVYSQKGVIAKAEQYYLKAEKARIQLQQSACYDMGTICNDLGWLYHTKGKYELAKSYLARAISINTNNYGQQNSSTAVSFNRLALVLRAENKNKEALEMFLKAQKLYIKVAGQNSNNNAAVLNNLGLVYTDMNNFDKALECLNLSIKIYIDNLGGYESRVANAYSNVGRLYNLKRNFDKSLQFYTKSLEIYQATFGKIHSSYARILQSIGGVYQNKGEFDKAITYYKNALEIYKQSLGQSEATGLCYNVLGLLLMKQKKNDQALQNYQKALKLVESTSGLKSLAAAHIYNNIGLIYGERKENKKSIDFLQKGVDSYTQSASGTADQLRGFKNLADAYYTDNNFEKSLQFYTKRLNLSLKLYQENNISAPNAYYDVGLALHAQKKYAEALPNYQNALRIYNQFLEDEWTMEAAKTHNNIAKVCQNLDKKKASDEYNKAYKIWKIRYGESDPKVIEAKQNTKRLRAQLNINEDENDNENQL